MFTHLLPALIRTPLEAWLNRRSFMLSQVGQDVWVFGEVFNEKRGGYFLDIGAHDGVTNSNTLLLETRYHWNGLCVEANPIMFERLRGSRRVHCINACLDDSEREVNFYQKGVRGGIIDAGLDNQDVSIDDERVTRLRTRTLASVLDEFGAPDVIDYLSIDTEGAEERILGHFDFDRYVFRCITIERPSDTLRQLLRDKGYSLVKEVPQFDCFYVHESFAHEYRQNLFTFFKKRQFAFRWK